MFQQERGNHFHEDFDIDEETKFSSVYRGKEVDDSGYGDIEDILSDSHNTETFGSLSIEKNNDGARLSSSFCSKVVPCYSLSNISYFTCCCNMTKFFAHLYLI